MTADAILNESAAHPERAQADIAHTDAASTAAASTVAALAHSDLGFGRVVAQAARGRFIARDGTHTSRKYGLGAQRAERFYLSALNARWLPFLGWLVAGMLLLNGSFALLYVSLGATAIAGSQELGLEDPFLRALSFSVGVFTTTGTGNMHAVGTSANWLVVLESLLGPIIMIAAGGLLIARLTRPRMQLRYSESMLVAPFEGGRGLMFRMVNAQPGDLSDVRARIIVSWYEYFDGVRERNFHQLKLERDSVELFNLHWTVVHPITAESPLAGMTPASLAEAEAEFIVFVAAHESTFSTRVTSRTSYTHHELRWDVKWASIFASSPDGVIAIDVDRLDRMERLDDGATRVPAALETASVVKTS